MTWTPFSAEAVKLHAELIRLNGLGRTSDAINLIVDALERARREGPMDVSFEDFESRLREEAQTP